MKKAIIYDMDPNGTQKVDNDKINPSELVFKSEIISFQSSKKSESESSMDEKRRDSSITLSPYTSTNAPNSTTSECDFFGTDESPTLSWKSEPLTIHPLENFQDKIKPMQYVKIEIIPQH